MNKLLIPDGGMPFHGDDINFMQEAYEEAIKALAQVPGDNYALSGCVITIPQNQAINDPLPISAGYVVLNGEILYFPGGQFLPAGNANPGGGVTHAYLNLKLEYPAEGVDVFADSISRDTYEVRTAKIEYDNNSTGIKINDLVYFKDLMKGLLDIDANKSTEMTLATGRSGSANAYIANGLCYVEVRVANGVSTDPVCTLPVGFRPETEFSARIALRDAPFEANARITPNGSIILSESDLSNGQEAYVNVFFKPV